MRRPYLTPEELSAICADDCSPQELMRRIDDACEEKRRQTEIAKLISEARQLGLTVF